MRIDIDKTPVETDFFFTSSGMHFLPAFICAYMAVGAEYPFETSKESLESLGILPICEADKKKFFHGNAEKLLKL
ncbi:MAG: hypothetical protein JRJ85_00050 [Deltaproteobacteria bacterium]|nr:hypothetical protein [Deltaproteobacteria bacterium]